MANYNKVLLMGNLTRDVELRRTANDLAIAKISLAVNHRFRTKEGETREETMFIDCDAFGRTAEVMHQYLAKGRPVFVEGRLKLDTWQDKDGGNRSKHVVIIDNFQFIDSKGGDGGQGSSGRSESYAAAPAGGGGQHQPIGDDDIPF